MKKWWHFAEKPYKEKEVLSWKFEMALVVLCIWLSGLAVGFILGSIVTGFFKQLI